jgi:hypothetical protein
LKNVSGATHTCLAGGEFNVLQWHQLTLMQRRQRLTLAGLRNTTVSSVQQHVLLHVVNYVSNNTPHHSTPQHTTAHKQREAWFD